MKHRMCSLPDVKIAADIDESARVVTLEIEALDTMQLLKVASQVLPEHGVVAYADETSGRDDRTRRGCPSSGMARSRCASRKARRR